MAAIHHAAATCAEARSWKTWNQRVRVTPLGRRSKGCLPGATSSLAGVNTTIPSSVLGAALLNATYLDTESLSLFGSMFPRAGHACYICSSAESGSGRICRRLTLLLAGLWCCNGAAPLVQISQGRQSLLANAKTDDPIPWPTGLSSKSKTCFRMSGSGMPSAGFCSGKRHAWQHSLVPGK